MALENYRIIEYPEKTEVDTSDYMLVDSESNGTNKYQVKRIITEAEAKVTAAVAAEADAREAADEALQTDINTRATKADLAAETAAREQDVDDLKADLTSEQTARENADTALQTAINAKADSTALTAEATARQSADNALGEDITALSGDVETNYARIDGYYDSLGVGMADQLASNKYTEDNEPYVYRTSGGAADIGDREYDEIVGGTVVWNQLVRTEQNWPVSDKGEAIYANGEYKITVTSAASGTSVYGASAASANVLKKDHIYFGYYSVKELHGNVSTCSVIPNGSSITRLTAPGSLSYIFKNTISSIVVQGSIMNNSGTNLTTDDYAIVDKAYAIDLTKMFGSTVADAIYALEQAEAGAGVAWFKKLFPKEYYAYNAGELKSVSALQSHDMVGFNQWDEEWEVGTINSSNGQNAVASDRIRSKNYTRIIDSMQYYVCLPDSVFNGNQLYVALYDTDKNFIRASLFNTANGFAERILTPYFLRKASYLRLWLGREYGATYKNDICINLSWSGWRNGEYEAYDKHSYPLDSSLTLRGIPKVDSAGNMYYDGDIYASDGTVTRRYGVVDLGTLDWAYDGDEIFRATTTSNIKFIGYGICTKYQVVQAASWSGVGDKQMSVTNSQAVPILRIHDSTAGTDATAFKAAMSGVMYVYELATTTTETAEPYASPQIVDDFGTEEYVSTADIPIPVGHNTKYMANLRDKLVHLPNLADSDGAYLIQQTGHTMELVKFRIPKAPTTDGTYTLKATVSGGTPTYTWEVVE